MRLTITPGLNAQPAISVHNDDVLIFWMDDQYGNWEIYSIYSKDGGNSWSVPVRFSDDLG